MSLDSRMKDLLVTNENILVSFDEKKVQKSEDNIMSERIELAGQKICLEIGSEENQGSISLTLI